MTGSPRDHLESVFRAALNRVDPYAMITSRLSVEGNTLAVASETETIRLDLSSFNRILLIGAGKAGATMARAVEDVLGDRLAEGLVVVKYGHGDEVRRTEVVEAGHPVPDQNGIEAGRRILDLAEAADERTLVIGVLSGGGSALLAAPYRSQSVELTLSDLVETNDALLRSGAPIQSVNCIRKHASAVKGGRLARAIYPATSLNLILSDVVGDALDSIASGPTSPDPTTYADSLVLVRRYELAEKLPANVRRLLTEGADGTHPETAKPGDEAFRRCWNVLLGTNFAALQAARTEAQLLGYATILLSSQITGEAREIAKVYAAVAKDQVRRGIHGTGPVCVIGGGETTVTVRGAGTGGRCQELALSYLVETRSTEAARRAWFLSASTDGSDGPTDAAGAFVGPGETEVDLDPVSYLDRNDSYSYFDACGSLLRTGPTKTNVCDIQVLAIP